MNLLLTILALCLLAMWALYRALRVQDLAEKNDSDLQRMVQSVDLYAFRNLIDPEERAFIRSVLSAAEFRNVERERIKVAIAYVRTVALNAAVFMRLGENARQADDLELAQAGRELSSLALKLRLKALRAQFHLQLSLLFPMQARPEALIVEYERIRECAAGIRKLAAPLPAFAG